MELGASFDVAPTVRSLATEGAELRRQVDALTARVAELEVQLAQLRTAPSAPAAPAAKPGRPAK